jgi:hypothetical protein
MPGPRCLRQSHFCGKPFTFWPEQQRQSSWLHQQLLPSLERQPRWRNRLASRAGQEHGGNSVMSNIGWQEIPRYCCSEG